MAKLLLAGDGWGAIAAFKSLRVSESHQLTVLTNDLLWKEQLMASGISCAENMDEEYDLIICAGWAGIIKEDLLRAKKFVNIHYTLLPAYRGFHGTVWAILNDEPYLGFTIHEMSPYIDDGPIVYQYKIENDFVKTSVWYMNHFNEKVTEILLQVVNDYLVGAIHGLEQDKSKASWVGKRTRYDCRIDFSKSVKYQEAFFRALVPPYPVPFFTKRGKEFQVHEAAFYECSVSSHLGRILNIDNEGIWISCKDGYVICKKITQELTGKAIDYNFFTIGQFVNVDGKQI